MSQEKNDIRLYMMDYQGSIQEPEDLLLDLDMGRFLDKIRSVDSLSRDCLVGDLLASAYWYRNDYGQRSKTVIEQLFAKGFTPTWSSTNKPPMLSLVFQDEDWDTFDSLIERKKIPYDCDNDRFILELVHACEYKQLMKLLQYYEQCLQK